MKNLSIVMSVLLLIIFNNNVFSQQFEAPKLEFVCELKVTNDPEMVVGETAPGEKKSSQSLEVPSKDLNLKGSF